MARTFGWRQPVTGNFDGPGNWADITTGTPVATLDVPGSADIAVFNGVAVTVGSAASDPVGTVEVTNSFVTLTGTAQFGALNVTGSTLDIAAQGTLWYVPAFQSVAQVAVSVATGANLQVAGAGAQLSVRDTVNANAYLQVAAAATVAVGAGASVSADVLDLAGNQVTGAFGSIDGGSTTTDSAAELDATWLAVGDGGMASLTVTNGALVTAGIVTVGFGQAAGAGSGTLLISAAGQVAVAGYAALGYGTGDAGFATIEDIGSAFASAGLFIGNAGSGSFTVRNGATLATSVEANDTSNFAGSIANAVGGTGTMLVDGVGSTWAISGRVDIGDGGPGTLDVQAGAAVRAMAGSVAVITDGTLVYYGTFSLSEATVAVRDAGSTLNAGGGPVYVGNGATASVSIWQGGAMSAGAPAVDFAAMQLGLNGGTGTLVVSDVTSRVTALGQIDVGGIGGSGNVGTLEVLAAATLLSGGQIDDPLAGLSVGDGIGSSGFASIDGAGSMLSNNGRMDIGRFGSGVLSITNSATLVTQLSAAAQATQPASVLLGVNQGADGTVFLAGNGTALIAAQGMIVGLGGTGTLQIIDAAWARLGGDLGIGSALGSGFIGSGTGLVSVAAGTLAVGGALALGGNDAGYIGSGTLSVAAGARMSVGGSATITAGSTIALGGGGLEIGGAGTANVVGMRVDAGATFAGAGTVQGGVQIVGTVVASDGVLALASASGTGTLALVAGGTLDVGTLNGGTVDFAGDGTLRLHAAPSGSALLVGLDGGTIDLAGMVATSAAYVGGTLAVDVGGTTMTMALAQPPPPGPPTIVSDGAGGSEVVLACFAAGTRLAGPAGPVAVERVRVGDVVCCAAGRLQHVVWVGQRTLDCRRHARPAEVHPVRVCAGAFAPGVPGRDVLLSPDHALFVEGSLIPVRYLLTGSSIAQEAASRITYCHVELASHDVLLAEGLPCESFLDTGNRHAFATHGEPVLLHAEFARAVWAEKGCAPLVLEGPALERARRHFLRRAAALGHRRTRNPALQVVAEGRALHARIVGRRFQVALPPGTTEVRLITRIWVPAQMRPTESDTRRLGVAIARLALDGREVALDSPALAQGWHAPEPHWRWSDGAGVLPVAGARALAFDLAMAGEYWVAPAGAAARAQPVAAG